MKILKIYSNFIILGISTSTETRRYDVYCDFIKAYSPSDAINTLHSTGRQWINPLCYRGSTIKNSKFNRYHKKLLKIVNKLNSQLC